MILLSVYLHEISEYSVSSVTVNRLKAFFLSLIGGNPEHQYELFTMLGKTEGKIAGEILTFLKAKINKC